MKYQKAGFTPSESLLKRARFKGESMVTIGMNYDVIPGKESLFEKAFESVLKAIEAAPGHTHSSLYLKKNQPNSYLILSEWNNEAAFKEFVASESFAKVTQWGKENILSGRPKHTVYHT
jgi:heme-degrading monooxygenase HmoA